MTTLAIVPGYAQPALLSGATNFGVQIVGAPFTTTLTYSFSQPFFLFTPLALTDEAWSASAQQQERGHKRESHTISTPGQSIRFPRRTTNFTSELAAASDIPSMP